MKHIFMTILAFAAGTMAATAQELDTDFERAGHLTTEIQFNPFSNNFNTFRMGELKFRYFLDEQSAIRVKLGFGYDTDTRTDVTSSNSFFTPTTDTYTITNKETETKTNKSAFSFAVGYERHISLMKRLSLYVGGELGFEGNYFSGEKNVTGSETQLATNSVDWTDYPAPYYTAVSKTYRTEYKSEKNYTEKTEYENMDPTGSNKNNRAFTISAFTGLDFHIYKGLYIGTEFGIRFATGKYLNGTYTINENSKQVENFNYSGQFPTYYTGPTTPKTVTTTSYRKFDSATGVTEAKAEAISTIASENPTTPVEPTYTSAPANDNSSTFSNFKIYIEPAIRLGWRF